MNLVTPFILFKPTTDSLDARTNMARIAEVSDNFKSLGIKYIPIKSCSPRYHAHGFLVSTKHIGLVHEYCQVFNQDSYTLVDANNRASLYDNTGKYLKELGSFIVSETAKGFDNYYLIQGRYYILLG